jgi:hypothetical protein
MRSVLPSWLGREGARGESTGVLRVSLKEMMGPSLQRGCLFTTNSTTVKTNPV